MKVVVYAICKNEEQFVDRWVDSMSEADGIYVLDTGSTDDTVNRLQARDVHVTEEKIQPWRFDTARNRSLELVPEDADICVCTDLDEVFHPGWRAALERAWQPGTGRAAYRYTWNFLENGAEGVVFWAEKIHARHGYQWSHPVHEVLAWAGEGQPGPKIYAEGIQLDHRADPTKSRGQYLPLLELSVQEAPEDDRNMHYLGREYMFYGRWRECEVTLLYHLQMPTATWADERCASMRYIALAQEQQGKASAEQWYIRAVGEAPWLREPWLDYAKFLYRRRDWAGVYFLTGRALAIAERPRTYIIAADSWGSMPHDLRALACWHLGLTEEAVAQGEAALSLAQKEEVARLQENLAWYRGERT